MIYIPLTYTRCRPKRFYYSNTLPIFDTDSFTLHNDKNFFDVTQTKNKNFLKLDKILINKDTNTYENKISKKNNNKIDIKNRADMINYLNDKTEKKNDIDNNSHYKKNIYSEKHIFFEKRAMPKNEELLTYSFVKADNCRFAYSHNGKQVNIFDVNTSYKLKSETRRIKKVEFIDDNVILRRSDCVYVLGENGLNGYNIKTNDFSICQVSKEVFLLSQKGIRILSHYDSVKEDSSEEDSLEIEKSEASSLEDYDECDLDHNMSNQNEDDTVEPKYDYSMFTDTYNDIVSNTEIEHENMLNTVKNNNEKGKNKQNKKKYKDSSLLDDEYTKNNAEDQENHYYNKIENANEAYNPIGTNAQKDGIDKLAKIIEQNKYKGTKINELHVPFYKIDGEKLLQIRATEHPRQILVATENAIFRVDLRQKNPILVYQANTMIRGFFYKNENILVQDLHQFSLLNNMQNHPYFTMHLNIKYQVKLSQNEIIAHYKQNYKFYDIKSLVEKRKKMYLDDYLGFDLDDNYNFFHKNGVVIYKNDKWVEIEQNLVYNKVRGVKTKFFDGGYNMERKNEYNFCDFESKKYNSIFDELFGKNVVVEQKKVMLKSVWLEKVDFDGFVREIMKLVNKQNYLRVSLILIRLRYIILYICCMLF